MQATYLNYRKWNYYIIAKLRPSLLNTLWPKQGFIGFIELNVFIHNQNKLTISRMIVKITGLNHLSELPNQGDRKPFLTLPQYLQLRQVSCTNIGDPNCCQIKIKIPKNCKSAVLRHERLNIFLHTTAFYLS